MIKITDHIYINEDKIITRFIRSPGPGGQHVNKVESAVQIRFDAQNNLDASNAMFRRLTKICGKRMTNDGVIIMAANDTRSQIRNKEIAIERLTDILKKAAIIPKRRVKTKPTKASKERRLGAKHHKGSIKKLRSKTIEDR